MTQIGIYMKSKWISKNPRTLAVVFEEGDELVAGLNQVAAGYKLAGSHFTGAPSFALITE